jgi:MoaA/NifB/PqqE/SkfB family radical SAM enzyme
MFQFNELYEVQIEITNKCQASCPMCSRNIRGGIPNENLIENSWTLDAYVKIFDFEVLNQLKKIIICGSYGDPILNDHLPEMIEYSLKVNPNLEISIATNGGARNVKWWKNLAKILKGKTHIVTFGIDGLEDTHHLYRIGTTYENVIKNARTFIDEGGKAEWQFILFKHNEHQVEEAEKRSKEFKFDKFTLVDTYRFIIKDTFDVYNKKGSISHVLEKSSKSQIIKFDVSQIKNYKKILNSIEIDCEAKRIKGIYIDAFYRLYPCCYIAGCMQNSDNHFEPLPGNDQEVKIAWRSGHQEIKKQIRDAVNAMGGFDSINVYLQGLKNIFNSGNYQRVWESQWIGDHKNLQCSAICGVNSSWSTSSDQF